MSTPRDQWNDADIDRLIQSSLNVEPSPSFLSRVRSAVAETTVDQEIQDALNIEPSPEFVARVRQRLEQDSSPADVESGSSRILNRRWTIAAGALAAAAAISVVAVINRPARQAPVRVVSSLEAPSAPLAAPPPAAQDTNPSATPTPATSAFALATAQPDPSVRVRVDSDSGSEVVVSRQEIGAFRQYLSSLDPDAFKATTVVERSPETAPLPAVQRLAIEPIVIDPINTSTE